VVGAGVCVKQMAGRARTQSDNSHNGRWDTHSLRKR
jgi:hypothetical protein